jgi:periplasmic divalent cation tolerance protein
MPAIVVLTTAPNIEEAESLAEKIVGAKLAACVQVLPGMKSFYFWEGAVRREPEHLLLIKTLPEKYEALESFILENHSYDVPEIVALKASKVSESYLAWLQTTDRPDTT